MQERRVRVLKIQGVCLLLCSEQGSGLDLPQGDLAVMIAKAHI
jgi:hypothetical protein